VKIGLSTLWILVSLMALFVALGQRWDQVFIVAVRAAFVLFLLAAFLTTSFQGRSLLAVLGLMLGIGTLVAFAAKWLLLLMPSLMLTAVFFTWWRAAPGRHCG